ncbi:MAG: hypothetical protein NC201_03140 [Prevotella sp.]|nr:hypothetical protein [Bacteroides sp.]MCM1366222.1 hypothetical protein [Prevotella sp.]MCM1436974.1 hypothetical protein [Prevotella sp.]
MRKLTQIFTSIILLAIFAACSSSKSEQAEKILTTVPADADVVAVLDIEGFLDGTGAVYKDGNVELPATYQSLFNKSKDDMNVPGVEVDVAAFFMRGSKFYFTCFLDDTKTFKQYLQQKKKLQFAKQGVVEIATDADGVWYAVCGDQYWCVSGGTPDDEEIQRYAEQDKGRSVLSQKFADKLVSLDHQLMGAGRINSLSDLVSGTLKNGMLNALIINAIYNNPEYILLGVDFSKSHISLDFQLCSQNGEASKFVLPLDKIDPKVLDINASGDLIFAAGIPSKVVEKLNKSFGSLLPFGAFSGIDGTVGIALQSETGNSVAVIKTNGKDIAELAQFFEKEGMSKYEIKDDVITLQTPQSPSGPLSFATASKEFAKAYLGVKYNCNVTTGGKYFSTMSLSLVPDGNSAKIVVNLTLK